MLAALGRAPADNVKGSWSFVARTQWDTLKGQQGDPMENRIVSGGATHMALVRGTADSSWIIHWNTGKQARLWLADSLKDSTVAVAVPMDSVNIFCAGQSILPDGRMMVVGGTAAGVTGETRVPVFDAKAYHNGSYGWTQADTMKYGRWYASLTTLGDGTMLTTSGNDYLNVQHYGGFKHSGGSDSLLDRANTLNLRKWLRWENDQTNAGTRPMARHGHSAVFHYSNGHTVFFGGMKRAGGVDSLTNEVRQLFLYNNEPDRSGSGKRRSRRMATQERGCQSHVIATLR